MAKKNPQLSLEEQIEELEQIITQISDTDVSLKDSLQLYEKGIALHTDCLKQLENYKEQIFVLQNTKEVLELDQEPKLKPLEEFKQS